MGQAPANPSHDVSRIPPFVIISNTGRKEFPGNVLCKCIYSCVLPVIKGSGIVVAGFFPINYAEVYTANLFDFSKNNSIMNQV
jgi:hypothetical protein